MIHLESSHSLVLTSPFLIIAYHGQDNENSLSERLEAKLTGLSSQVGANNEHTTLQTKGNFIRKITVRLFLNSLC